MKKIFTYLAVAALMAVACDDMYGPVETPTTPDKAGSVEIQIDTLGDDTLKFTLTPAADASYFSYLVTAGPAQTVDSTAVYQCKLDGMIKGTYLASENPSVTLALGELAPNTPYTIYAVAGSPQGIPGSVAVKEVTTTDGIAIGITAFEAISDSSVVLSFSEKVFLGEGKITATYYASNLGMQAMGAVEAVADSIIVDGNTVTVQFAGLPHGAHWAVSYPEGTFTDSAANKIKAFNSGYSAENEKFVGISARRDTVSFELVDTLSSEQLMFSDWQTAAFSVAVASDSTLAAAGKGKVTANYLTPGKQLTIDMTLDINYKFGEGGVMMVCPEQPAFGTTVVFSFPQDSFQDIWGNPTKAVEYASLCAYDYTVEDVLGTYQYAAYSAYDDSESTGTLVIEPSDNPEKGNVMFTTMYSTECISNVYATFVPTSGQLTVKSPQLYGIGEKYAYGFATADPSGNPSSLTATFKMPERGVLTFEAETCFIGDLALDPTTFDILGFFDLYYYLEAHAVESVPAEPAAVVRSLKPALK
jgi:hypothetical protein